MQKVIDKENKQLSLIKSKINAYHFFIDSNDKYIKSLNVSIV